MNFTAFYHLPVWGYLLLALILTHITIISVTIFLHRHQAHRALGLHPVLSHFFRFWLWLTTGIVTREWVAIHRKHHARCETDEDPHSPQIKGLNAVLWNGYGLYRKAAADRTIVADYGSGTPDDWLERHLYARVSWLGISLLLAGEVLLFGWAGLAVWIVQMIWIPFWAAGVINGIGHFWGYRNFDLPNAATNILPWGILIGGEELHNNHHAFASSAKLSNRWWEFDLGWFYIRLFSWLGLAQVHKMAPRRRLSTVRDQLDIESVKSLTVNRLQLLADYRKKVLQPVFREEIDSVKRSWRRLYRKAMRLARRDSKQLSTLDREKLEAVLKRSDRLQTVYRFKLLLLEVWTQRGKNYNSRLVALKQWSAEAEASGIKALADFARLMRCYELPLSSR